ncbi:MAG: Opacity protein [Hyphomicrobiales bacterium]|nr:Opacity protein [Hyphomicrobiales bacterium]
MQFQTSTTVTALLALLAPGIALAADLPMRTAPASFIAPEPVTSWEGFYAGSFYGAGHSKFTSTQTVGRSVTRTGQTGGALAGYNFQSGAFVYGVEGDLGLHLIRTENPGAAGLIAHSVDTLYSGHLRARFGYDLGAFMPFVAGGLTYNESYLRLPAPNDYQGAVRSRYGWTAGAGLDWKVTAPFVGPLILRAEYLYEGLPSANYTVPGGPVSMKVGTHFLRAALIYTPTLRGWRSPGEGLTADWNGAYAGVLAGYGQSRARTTNGIVSESQTADGALGGLYAGRNIMFGNFMAGFEGSTALTNWKGTGIVPGTLDGLSYRNYIEADIRGRVGYAFGRFLPYLSAGMAWGRSEQIDRVTGSERGRIPTEAWTIGAGVDYMIAERVSARVEYLHQKTLKNISLDLNGAALDQSRSADIVRVGVAYHFH